MASSNPFHEIIRLGQKRTFSANVVVVDIDVIFLRVESLIGLRLFLSLLLPSATPKSQTRNRLSTTPLSSTQLMTMTTTTTMPQMCHCCNSESVPHQRIDKVFLFQIFSSTSCATLSLFYVTICKELILINSHFL